MAPGATGTGGVLEAMVLPALALGGYSHRIQVEVGTRVGGRKHKVDVFAEKDGRGILISMKWQQTSGTAEQKVPFEVICLAEAVRTGLAAVAYLVLGGGGWTLREFYVGGGLHQHLRHGGLVNVVTLEDFVAKANRGLL